MSTMPKQKPGKSEQSVATPKEFLGKVRELLGVDYFDIDLAADEVNSVSQYYFSKGDNSLTQNWIIKTCKCGYLYGKKFLTDKNRQREIEGHDCSKYSESYTHEQSTKQNMLKMQNNISPDIGMVWPKESSNSISSSSNSLVPKMYSGTSQKQNESQKINGARKSFSGEKSSQTFTKRTREETAAISNNEPCEKIAQNERPIYMGQPIMESVSSTLGQQLCLLQPKNEVSTRSFHSVKQQGLSGNSSLEYSSSLSNMQPKQRTSVTGNMDERPREVCPNCSTIRNFKTLKWV